MGLEHDNTFFWMAMIIFFEFSMILILLACGINLARENWDFKRRLGRLSAYDLLPLRTRFLIWSSRYVEWLQFYYKQAREYARRIISCAARLI